MLDEIHCLLAHQKSRRDRGLLARRERRRLNWLPGCPVAVSSREISRLA